MSFIDTLGVDCTGVFERKKLFIEKESNPCFGMLEFVLPDFWSQSPSDSWGGSISDARVSVECIIAWQPGVHETHVMGAAHKSVAS